MKDQNLLSPSPVATQLFHALLQVSALASERNEAILVNTGITGARLALLLELSRAGQPVAPSELGRRLMVTRANISLLLAALEQMQLIERVAHHRDGRVRLAKITDRGQELLLQAVPLHHRCMEQTMAGLSSEEQAQMLFLLGKLIGYFQALNNDKKV